MCQHFHTTVETGDGWILLEYRKAYVSLDPGIPTIIVPVPDLESLRNQRPNRPPHATTLIKETLKELQVCNKQDQKKIIIGSLEASLSVLTAKWRRGREENLFRWGGAWATNQSQLLCLVLKTQTAVIRKHISVHQLAAERLAWIIHGKMTYTQEPVSVLSGKPLKGQQNQAPLCIDGTDPARKPD